MKECACGRSISPISWPRLELLGTIDNGRGVGELLELRLCDRCRSTLAVPIGEHAPSSPRLRSARPAVLDMAAYVGHVRKAIRVSRESFAEEAARLSSVEHARGVAQVYELERRLEAALVVAEEAFARWRAGAITEDEFKTHLDEPERIMLEVAFATATERDVGRG